jgi:transcriptional regulator with XRE-family HTH domain/tetratricopeptide (TPR) repeat protein
MSVDLSAESFQGLTLRLRGRTGLTQLDLAARLGKHSHSVQGWESGLHVPSADSLQALLIVYLRSGGFLAGREVLEAEAVWEAARRSSRHLQMAFDREWFADQVARRDSVLAQVSLVGEGEMADRVRAFDWANSPLGALAAWPQALRTSAEICLTSRLPIVLFWGPDLTLLYNDAYARILGRKHAWALGRRGRDVWEEVWGTIGSALEGVMATARAMSSDDLRLVVERNNYLEECYFSFSFSPVRGAAGEVAGVFGAVLETTQQAHGERRLHALLMSTEELLFRRLGVFQQGFSLQAASVIAAAGLGAGVQLTLRSLVDKSLVQVTDEPELEPRFSLPETLREHAWRWLVGTPECGEIQRAHAAYYLALAEREAHSLERGPDQASAFACLEREHANLLAALGWAAHAGDVQTELRLVVSLRSFWWTGGSVREGWNWLEDALSKAADQPVELREKALEGIAFLTSCAGEYSTAAARLDEALGLARAAGDAAAIARVLGLVVNVVYLQGHPERCHEFAREINAASHAGDPPNLYYALHCLGMAAYESGDQQAAVSYLNDARAFCERAGDQPGVAASLACLSIVARRQADTGRALSHVRQAIHLARQRSIQVVVAWCTHAAVRVCAELASPAVAARLLGAADALAAANGLRTSPNQQALHALVVGRVRAALGDQAFAAAWADGRALSADATVDAVVSVLDSAVAS